MNRLGALFAILAASYSGLAWPQNNGMPQLDPGPMRENAIVGTDSKLCSGAKALVFYPVGFNKTGSFAYITYTDEDAVNLWTFVITNLVKDRLLKRITMEDPDGELDLDSFLSKRRSKIRQALWKEAITEGNTGKPGSWPIRKDEDLIRLIFLSYPPKAGEDHSTHLANLLSKKRGQKKITTLKAPGDEHCCKSLGYYLSPDGKRAAVLVLHGSRGFEGTIVCDVAVIGAHLEAGFKKTTSAGR